MINIDQSPIGRTPRSNPATYIGFYDAIRALFAATPEAQATRLHRLAASASTSRVGAAKSAPAKARSRRRCSSCPTSKSSCTVCKGERYNEETLEVTYNGKNIADVLDTVRGRGGRILRRPEPPMAHKIGMLDSSAWATSGSAIRRPRSPAARRSASSWPASWASSSAASTTSTSWTSRRPGCTSPTSSGCSTA